MNRVVRPPACYSREFTQVVSFSRELTSVRFGADPNKNLVDLKVVS